MKEQYEGEVKLLKAEIALLPPRETQEDQQQQLLQQSLTQSQERKTNTLFLDQLENKERPLPSLDHVSKNVFGAIISGSSALLSPSPLGMPIPDPSQFPKILLPSPQPDSLAHPNSFTSAFNQPGPSAHRLPSPLLPPFSFPNLAQGESRSQLVSAVNHAPPHLSPNRAENGSHQTARSISITQSDLSLLQQNAIKMGNLIPKLNKIPPRFVKHVDDWSVVYNGMARPIIDVDLIRSLDNKSIVCSVKFSPDGRYIAAGGNWNSKIFETQTGRLICVLEDESTDKSANKYIRAVCFSPDGRYLATGSEDNLVRVWDIAAGRIQQIFRGHEQEIYAVDYSQDGRTIASGAADRTVRIWDMESGECVLTLSTTQEITAIAISPDGHYVAGGGADNSVHVWGIDTGFLVERLGPPNGHSSSIHSISFSPNGQDLISTSIDKTIKLWELQRPRRVIPPRRGGVCANTFVGHKDSTLAAIMTPDARWIISGSRDRTIKFWDPCNTQVQLSIDGHNNSAMCLDHSPICGPNGGLFVSGGGDNSIRIWRYYPNPIRSGQ